MSHLCQGEFSSCESGLLTWALISGFSLSSLRMDSLRSAYLAKDVVFEVR